MFQVTVMHSDAVLFTFGFLIFLDNTFVSFSVTSACCRIIPQAYACWNLREWWAFSLMGKFSLGLDRWWWYCTTFFTCLQGVISHWPNGIYCLHLGSESDIFRIFNNMSMSHHSLTHSASICVMSMPNGQVFTPISQF